MLKHPTQPLLYEEDAKPFDSHRHTHLGLTHLLERPGFELENIDWLDGYFGTLNHQTRTAACTISFAPRHHGGGLIGIGSAALAAVLKPSFAVASRCIGKYESRHKYCEDRLCKNDSLHARRVFA